MFYYKFYVLNYTGFINSTESLIRLTLKDSPDSTRDFKNITNSTKILVDLIGDLKGFTSNNDKFLNLT